MTNHPMARATYELRIDGTPPDAWRVRRFELTEAIARPYELVVLAYCTDEMLDVGALLGAEAELLLTRGDTVRTVRGLVFRVAELGGQFEAHLELELAIGPAVALAAQRVDTRIFQDESAPLCATSVLGDFLAPYGRGVTGRYASAHAPRDYCVQYREDDLAFARRMLEEDGLFYVFEQPDDCPEVVLVLDDNAGLPAFEAFDGSDEIELIEDVRELSGRDAIVRFEWASSLQPTSGTRAEFDLASPSSPVIHELQHQAARGWDREIYRHDDRRWSHDDGARLLEHERLATEARRRRGRATSNAIGITAGTRFTLLGRGAVADDRLLVTRVTHRGDNPEVDPGEHEEGAAPSYENHFECVAADVPFRLRRTTPKPRTHGAETAIVTGPQGEEIHTDALGRVKVAFHWDRLGRRDEFSSCWLRVVQRWAGHGFGALFVPRIGMEVLVEFLGGDPDRPCVVGCLYNGANAPPYPLPDEKTRTTLRTQSSPGGDGFNELSFEDRAGGEQVFLHAQRDLVETVKRNEVISVGSDRQASIGRHDSLSVGGDQHVTVDGNQTLVVDGGGKAGTKGTTAAIKGAFEVRVTEPGHLLIDAASSITLQCGASSITIDPTSIKVAAGAGTFATFDVEATVMAAGGATATLSEAVAMRSAAGSAMSLSGAVQANSAVGSTLALGDGVVVTSAGAATLTLDLDAALAGSSVTAQAGMGSALVLNEAAALTGLTTATCTAGGATGGRLELGGTGADLQGMKVGITAAALAEVVGKLVKIN